MRHETGLRTTGNAAPPEPLLPQNTPADERERMRILMEGKSVRGTAEQIDSGLFADLWKVWPHRPIVFDEEKGLVTAFPLFIQNGDTPLAAHSPAQLRRRQRLGCGLRPLTSDRQVAGHPAHDDGLAAPVEHIPFHGLQACGFLGVAVPDRQNDIKGGSCGELLACGRTP
ncbi:hypothetical protein SCAB_14621 [Streptomyces scabiei 87.22]|uniref:Uncharacterized protein n=1 Tax=Streptomyces scabiei (strain 87.22) TaxID=680198 RepID=C9ZA15_STRSW|nr:hypothetical protein [Streptomyces scabiei]CBG68610.1 hypothetical protein SCAB_14621 [Streptomyces scabiei 87.22]